MARTGLPDYLDCLGRLDLKDHRAILDRLGFQRSMGSRGQRGLMEPRAPLGLKDLKDNRARRAPTVIMGPRGLLGAPGLPGSRVPRARQGRRATLALQGNRVNKVPLVFNSLLAKWLALKMNGMTGGLC